MPDAPAGWGRWRRLGRLLPRDVRERIFEPAFADLLHAWRAAGDGHRTVPFGLLAVGTWFGCVPIALPRLFVRDRRLTRLGRVTVWSVAVVASALFVFLNVVRPYLGYSG